MPTANNSVTNDAASEDLLAHGFLGLPAVDNSRFRLLGSWQENTLRPCHWPWDSVVSQYPLGDYPRGYLLPGSGIDTMGDDCTMNLHYLRQAGEAHRQTRRYLQSFVQPGMKMVEIVERAEAASKSLMGGHSLEAGWAFPTGCSLNECAAHYTPNPGDQRILKEGDICKIDFGLHVKGHLVDSAFTIAFDPEFDPLVAATKAATDVGIKAAGPDAILGEIGALIQETIESYEMTYRGKPLRIRAVKNLTGHSILPYRIHGGKSLPITNCKNSKRMEEGDVFACETFATTGKGNVQDQPDCSHFMQQWDHPYVHLKDKTTRDLKNYLENNHKTLAFCRRWLHDAGHTRHLLALKNMIDCGIVDPYPPLSDIPGSFTSQFEHTFAVKAAGVEVFTRGDDY